MLEDLKALFHLYGDKIINDMIDKMNAEGVHHTMTAAKSLRYKATSGGVKITGADYVDIISEGRRRNRKPPPPRNLEAWVRDKMGENDPKRIKQLSFAVSKKIGMDGTQGINLYTYVINKNITGLFRDISDITEKQLGKKIENTLKAKRYSRMQVSGF